MGFPGMFIIGTAYIVLRLRGLYWFKCAPRVQEKAGLEKYQQIVLNNKTLETALRPFLFDFKGVLHPGQFLDCFCIFLKNYNTLVTRKICFL